jgi:hypothetical protein
MKPPMKDLITAPFAAVAEACADARDQLLYAWAGHWPLNVRRERLRCEPTMLVFVDGTVRPRRKG